MAVQGLPYQHRLSAVSSCQEQDQLSAEDEQEQQPSADRWQQTLWASGWPQTSAGGWQQVLADRLTLAKVVPGLEGSGLPPPPPTTLVYMVQITSAGTVGVGNQVVVVGSVEPPSSLVTQSTSPGNPIMLRPSAPVTNNTQVLNGITLAQSPRPSAEVASVRIATPLRPSSTQILSTASPIRALSPGKRIQYICKQGGQTFLIESSALLDRIRAAGGGLQLRLPVSALRPISILSGGSGQPVLQPLPAATAVATASTATAQLLIGQVTQSTVGNQPQQLIVTGNQLLAAVSTAASSGSATAGKQQVKQLLLPTAVYSNSLVVAKASTAGGGVTASRMSREDEGLGGRSNLLSSGSPRPGILTLTTTTSSAPSTILSTQPELQAPQQLVIGRVPFTAATTATALRPAVTFPTQPLPARSVALPSHPLTTRPSILPNQPVPTVVLPNQPLPARPVVLPKQPLPARPTILPTQPARPVLPNQPLPARPGGLANHTVVVRTSLNQTTVATALSPARAVLAQAGSTVTATSSSPVAAASSTSSNTGPADLIRQLNLARAQGLVVLQQWGDKQVLVHKATGRWIMRQGNRLVTVPPQALGISPGGGQPSASPIAAVTATTDSASAAAVVATAPAPPPPSLTVPPPPSSPAILSSRTMEQLAEFDSILESKFQFNSSLHQNNTSNSITIIKAEEETVPLQTAVAALVSPPEPRSISPGKQLSVKKEADNKLLVAATIGQLKAAVTNPSPKLSPLKGPVSPTAFPKPPPPKPQEDPETLKRIQAILDDYNDQIRNSPDLHNRPAPRRRTNGNPDSPKPDSLPGSGSSSPNSLTQPLPSLSPNLSPAKQQQDTLSLAVAEIKETLSLSMEQPPVQENVQLVPVTSPTTSRPVRQVVVPSSLAANLTANGHRLMVVNSSDGRRMVALRPILLTPTPPPAANSFSSGLGFPLPLSVSLPTSPVPVSAVSAMSGLSQRPPPPLLQRLARSITPPPMLKLEICPTSPAGEELERAATPGLGIPMEMTPGQIMEAEISASFLDSPSTDFPGSLHSPGRVPVSLPENVFCTEPMANSLTEPLASSLAEPMASSLTEPLVSSLTPPPDDRTGQNSSSSSLPLPHQPHVGQQHDRIVLPITPNSEAEEATAVAAAATPVYHALVPANYTSTTPAPSDMELSLVSQEHHATELMDEFDALVGCSSRQLNGGDGFSTVETAAAVEEDFPCQVEENLLAETKVLRRPASPRADLIHTAVVRPGRRRSGRSAAEDSPQLLPDPKRIRLEPGLAAEEKGALIRSSKQDGVGEEMAILLPASANHAKAEMSNVSKRRKK